MKKEKLLGYFILIFVFGGIFAMISIAESPVVALSVFAASFGLAALIIIAVKLINE